MNDNDIIKYFNKFKIIKWKLLPNEIIEYLINRYNDLSSDDKILKLKETYYRINNNLEICPVCPICGKLKKFLGKTYSKTCGNRKCLAKECQYRREQTNINKYGYSNNFKSPNNQDKVKQSCILKYGVDNPWKLKEIQNKCKKTIIKNNNGIGAASQKIKLKMEQTNINKYGWKHNWQDPEEQKRSHSTEAKEKQKKTCLKKYGVEFTGQADIKKQHTKETCLKKYGVDHISKVNYIKEKQIETKRKNCTLNTSKIEDESYILLKEKYSDIKRQYKSDLYPFNCDFYIPSLDLYIECQYGQFHHHRPYIGNKQDLKDIEILKEKADKIHKQNNVIQSRYDVELETWTIRDVNKRNIAKENNLNYIEFWNINELKEWIKFKNEQ